MSADSYVMCISKANIQLNFVNVSVQRRKAVCLGCVVFLDELVMIGLGIRLRQGFAGEGLRIGYKPDDRIHPKIKQKKRTSKISLQSSLYKRRRLPTLPHCIAVPSAQTGLTSLFGMGRGGTPPQ